MILLCSQSYPKYLQRQSYVSVTHFEAYVNDFGYKNVYLAIMIDLDGLNVFRVLIRFACGGDTPLLEKRARTLFSKELMGKNIALLIMIDYDTRMIVVPRS